MTHGSTLDPHLNLFAAYGQNRFWENNVTGAIGKLLHYSSEHVRRSFFADFLEMAVPDDLDSRVVLQRGKDAESDRPGRLLAFLLEPAGEGWDEDALDESDEPKETARPDLWLLDRRVGCFLEVKLRPGEGREQLAQAARTLGAKIPKQPVRTFEGLQAWLRELDCQNAVEKLLRDELIEFLDDAGFCDGFPGFSDRDLEISEQVFVNPRRVRGRMRRISEAVLEAAGDVLVSADRASIGAQGGDCYVGFAPTNHDLLGYPTFGLHANFADDTVTLSPTVFLSGGATSLGLKRSGAAGMRHLLRRLEDCRKSGVASRLQGVLEALPVNGNVGLKTYIQRVKVVEKHEFWDACVWTKQGPDRFESYTGNVHTGADVVEAIRRKARREHGKDMGNNRRRYAAVWISRPSLGHDELTVPAPQLIARLESEVRAMIELLEQLGD